MELEIRDRAPADNPLQAPEADVAQPIEERAPGGLGLHFVRTVMDGMEYAHEAERTGSGSLGISRGTETNGGHA